jgi:hypothetical protein
MIPGRLVPGSLPRPLTTPSQTSDKRYLYQQPVLGQLLHSGLGSSQVRREAWSAMFMTFGLVN